MSRKTPTPDKPREASEQVPDRLELRCKPGNITLEALAAEGSAEAIPRFMMIAYTGEPMRVEGGASRSWSISKAFRSHPSAGRCASATACSPASGTPNGSWSRPAG